MSVQASRGPIVIDTDVFGADLIRRSALAERYEPIIVGRPAFISFQTAAELRYGALRRGWGEKRMRELEARIGAAETVHTGPDLILTYARGFELNVNASGTHWPSVTMTQTVGLQRLPYALGYPWYPTTASSTTRPGW